MTKAVSALDPIDGCPCLCRISGCRVLDQPVLCNNGAERPWTISRYLCSVFVTSTNYKLEVALCEVIETAYQLVG